MSILEAVNENGEPGANNPTLGIGAPAVSQAQIERSSDIETKPTIKLCEVCNRNPSKYKCTRCYLPYCSVLCSKQHQASHSADEPPNILPTPPPPVPKVKPATLPRPGTVAAAGVRSSFAVLDDSEQLRTLFRTYPGLASQLKRIHDATLRPCEDTELNAAGHKRHSKSGGRDWDFKTRKQPWTPDRGLENGVRALNRARQDCGDSGEAVREFSDLILQLMRREEGGIDVAEIIQRELTEKSTKLIEQLLQEEMAKLRPTW